MISIILSIIFLVLSLLHFYWVFGGKWILDGVVPTKQGATKPLFEAPPIATLIVALGLLFFSWVYYAPVDQTIFGFPQIIYWIKWIVPCLFLLRAIGEFNYVGLFKKIKDTKFGQNDTKYFAPLCLLISLLGFYLQLS